MTAPANQIIWGKDEDWAGLVAFLKLLSELGFGLLMSFSGVLAEPVVHFKEWTTSSLGFGLFDAFSGVLAEPVVHFKEWTTSSEKNVPLKMRKKKSQVISGTM